MNKSNWHNNYQGKQCCKFLNSVNSDADKIGPAIYTARALLRGVDKNRMEYMNDCEKVYPASNSNREANSSNTIDFNAIQENGFSISPNPASSFITIFHNNNFNYLIIEELNGKLGTSVPISNENKSELFDISNLANGVYILKLGSQEKETRVKLIISI